MTPARNTRGARSNVNQTINLGMKKKKSAGKKYCKICNFVNSDSLLNDGTLEKMRQSENMFHNVIVKSKCGYEVKAHSFILLSLGSKFKKEKLEPEEHQQLKCVQIDASAGATEQLVKFAYTGRCHIHQGNVSELMKIAKGYGIKSLLKLGGDFSLSELKFCNAFEMYRLSKECFCSEITAQVKSFILQNFMPINDHVQDWGSLSITDLEEILKDDELNVKEEKLFEIIENLAEHCDERGENVCGLAQHLRYTLMAPKFFNERVEPSPLIEHSPIAKPIARARGYFSRISRTRSSKMFKPKKGTLPFRIPSEILFAIGGWANSPTEVVETFDIRSQTWNTLGSFGLKPRAYHGLAALGKSIFLLGGYDGNNYFAAMSSFDPEKNVWQEKAPMNYPRCYVSCTSSDGKIYAIGGFNGVTRLRTAECYDPATNIWTLLPSMNSVRSDACAVALNGKVYVMGGFTGHQILDSTEIFDTNTGEWSAGAALNQARSGLRAIVHKDLIYVIGGFDGEQRLKSVECFNPRTEEWNIVRPLETQRSNFTASVIDDKIIVMGGFDGIGVIDKTEMYCPEKNTWTENVPMNVKRSALSSVTLSGLPNSPFFVNRQTDMEK